MTKQITKAQKTAINQAFAQCLPFTVLPVFDWAHKKTPTTYNV